MPPRISRKIKIRDGHRAAVKRLAGKAEEILDSLSPINFDRLSDQLTQIKCNLYEKRELLTTLDKEIVDSIDENDIIEEIELSDEYKDLIQLTLTRLESSLSNDSKNMSRPGPKSDATNPIEINKDDDSPTPQPKTKPCIKLPKLDLRKFDGDLSKWQTFWDSFQASIHNNPSVSAIDKFNYLMSLVEKSASDAISGLSLTAANYDEAISILQHRFGNKQQIINRHMELLLGLEPVTSNQNIKALRQLYDTVESNVRSLKSLGIASDTYGSLLTSVLMNKLPHDMRLTISRESHGDNWVLDELLEIFRKELEARERAFRSTTNTSSIQSSSTNQTGRLNHSNKNVSTATALFTNDSSHRPTCTYCRMNHPSASCKTVTNIEDRKNLLRRYGRCFICLKRQHLARNCPSNMKCLKCSSRHHLSICTATSTTDHRARPPDTHGGNQSTNSTLSQDARQFIPQQSGGHSSSKRNDNSSVACMYTGTCASFPVLLQTAKPYVYSPNYPNMGMTSRAILDSGSQRSYITTQLRDALNLPSIGRQTIRIKTFGSKEEGLQTVDLVDLCIKTDDGADMKLTAFVVPFICDPLQNQFVIPASQNYVHLSGLWLADYTTGEIGLEINILIGSDHYWNLVTGRILRGEDGPQAIHTRIGWVLSGPIGGNLPTEVHTNNLITTHVLKCSTQVANYDDCLTGQLKKFWDLESIGIGSKSVYEEFLETITFKKNYYEVHLPWKTTHPVLPDNYELSLKRLQNLLKRLQRDPEIFQEYDNVIRDQIKKGIVEVVPQPEETKVPIGNIHYIPHHPVLRSDKSTTKLRIVYDASARSVGPSLNDCVFTGPILTQKIMDIMLRFRSYRVALAGDIEKAFLMVRMADEDKDVLRFLWIDGIKGDQAISILRFTRVVFGVSSSPFLLNATIKHHIEKYEEEDPEFVRKFLNSIYVDDLTAGSNSVDDAYSIYLKSKLRLSGAGFNLRKFVTNSEELRQRIQSSEDHIPIESSFPADSRVFEDDETYTRSSLGSETSGTFDNEQKILGIKWDYSKDQLVFNLQYIASEAKMLEPTKRNVISLASKFYDPLGIVSPVIIQFKLLFQELCKDQRDWDTPLDGEFKIKWDSLVDGLSSMQPVYLPRCYLFDINNDPVSYQLIGFCDASQSAYGAVVYLRIVADNGTYIRFIASKTRVSPIAKQTIPRLELLSALVLARLIDNIKVALEPEIDLLNSICYSDSKVALYWIVQPNKEWKQFVQNRVDEIRTLIPDSEICWKHCPGQDNPADILSRGINPSELATNSLWWFGPDWLKAQQAAETNFDDMNLRS